MEFTLWLELLLFVALMGLSGFFSSSETALFSLSQAQLEQMRRDENPRIALIERMLAQPRRLIMTILIGNELVNVAASVISAAVVIHFLGAENKFVNLFIMVPILLIVGEITPKTLAIRNNVAFATSESRPISAFAKLIAPVRWLVRRVADFFITLIVGKERSRGNIVTEDLVRTLAHEAVGEGTLDHQEAKFIDKIFEFGDKILADVITPRSNVFFLAVETPFDEIIQMLRETRYTKVPVYQGHRDSVIGILHTRDLLGIDLTPFRADPGSWVKLLRESYFVPDAKPAAELFDTFRRRKLSMALTVDEYGGVTGLVTMEDLLECIFGEIPSPSDKLQQGLVEKLDDHRFAVEGSASIADLNRSTGIDFCAIEAESVAGLLLHEFGELPTVGSTIQIDKARFTVTAVNGNRIERAMLEIEPHAASVDAEGTARIEADSQQDATRPEMPTTPASADQSQAGDESAGQTSSGKAGGQS